MLRRRGLHVDFAGHEKAVATNGDVARFVAFGDLRLDRPQDAALRVAIEQGPEALTDSDRHYLALRAGAANVLGDTAAGHSLAVISGNPSISRL